MKSRSIRTLSSLAASALFAAGSFAAGDQPIAPPQPTTMSQPVTMPAPAVSSISVGSMSGDACIQGACCPEPTQRFSVFGDFLLLKARDVDVHYAQIMNGCGTQATPVGEIANAETEYSPGFRLGGVYYLDQNAAVQLTYTYWESSVNDGITAQNGNIVSSLLTAPNTLNCGSDSQAASSHYRLEFQLIDLDYKHSLFSGCNYCVDYVVGTRYAHLDQNFDSLYSILGATAIDTRINFDGIGPRLGLEGEQGIGHGLWMYGRSTVDILAGHFGSSFRQQNTFAGVQGLANYDDDRIVPMVDLELGVGWTNRSGRIRIEGGYMFQGWFNTVTTSNLIDSVHSGNFSGNGNSLKNSIEFDGLTARVAFRF